jgi:exopolyphosphatase/guanosine-5'-triphosphate,3'-diphosphate pyrophosphatase
LIRAGHVNKVQLEGLREDRRAVIGGGVSILRALMKLLKIDTLHVAQGALRHGVLFEMVKREDDHSDMRDVSVQRLALKLAVDTQQSQRVSQVAMHFLESLFAKSKDNPTQFTRLSRKLTWACQLHEVGVAISHSDYHKHGAYILDNADLVGFSMPELHRLSLLVLGQRGKLKKLDAELEESSFAKMLMALRLSLILCHARANPDYQNLTLACDDHKQRVTLTASETWSDDYPQSCHLLKQEMTAWQKTPWQFDFVTKS